MRSQCLSGQQCGCPVEPSPHGEQPGPLWGPGLWGHLPQSILQQTQNEPLVVCQSCDLSLTVIQAGKIITLTTTLSRHIWAYTLITELLCIVFAFLPQAHGNQHYLTRVFFLVRAMSSRLLMKWWSSPLNHLSVHTFSSYSSASLHTGFRKRLWVCSHEQKLLLNLYSSIFQSVGAFTENVFLQFKVIFKQISHFNRNWCLQGYISGPDKHLLT